MVFNPLPANRQYIVTFKIIVISRDACGNHGAINRLQEYRSSDRKQRDRVLMRSIYKPKTIQSLRMLNRRSFLKWMIITGITTPFPLNAFGREMPCPSSERILSLHNIHTGEQFKDVYWAEGHYIIESLNDINRILRDHRTDETIPIDTRLIDLLHSINATHGDSHTIRIVSAYRSPKTNEYLRLKVHGVARNSLHKKGMAADMILPGVPLMELRKTAVKLKAGGVGYYPKRNFIHIDTGRVRYW
jgi:uncharacterized protein YcbK (DUF882 family)